MTLMDERRETKRDWIEGVPIHCEATGAFVGVLRHGCLYVPDRDHGERVWRQLSVRGLVARLDMYGVE